MSVLLLLLCALVEVYSETASDATNTDTFVQPVQNFENTASSETTLSFAWITPNNSSEITGYNLICIPLLQDIPTPEKLALGPNATTANMTTLCSGVTYDCSIISLLINRYSQPSFLNSTTVETAPSGAPEMFAADAGQREVNFTWSPPSMALCNGLITTYILSCSPSPSPQFSSHLGPLTLTGFTPDTSYWCSVEASNSQGSGPPANISFTTQQDYSYFQLHLIGTGCSAFVTNETDEKLADITGALLEEFSTSCQCNSTSVIIDRQFFACFPESATAVTYRARLGGTAETDTHSFISLIERWVMDGASIIVGEVWMPVDSTCRVEISSLGEKGCLLSANLSAETSIYIILRAISGWAVAVLLIFNVAMVFVIKSICKRSSVRNAKHKAIPSPIPPAANPNSTPATCAHTARNMPKGDSPGRRAGDDRQYLPMSLPQDKPDNEMDLYDVAYPRPFYQVPCQSCGALAEWGEDDDYEHMCVYK